MTARRRRRLVPEGGVEVFEIRIALYLEAETGDAYIDAIVETIDGNHQGASIHEILGAIRRAERILEEQFDAQSG